MATKTVILFQSSVAAASHSLGRIKKKAGHEIAGKTELISATGHFKKEEAGRWQAT